MVWVVAGPSARVHFGTGCRAKIMESRRRVPSNSSTPRPAAERCQAGATPPTHPPRHRSRRQQPSYPKASRVLVRSSTSNDRGASNKRYKIMAACPHAADNRIPVANCSPFLLLLLRHSGRRHWPVHAALCPSSTTGLINERRSFSIGHTALDAVGRTPMEARHPTPANSSDRARWRRKTART